MNDFFFACLGAALVLIGLGVLAMGVSSVLEARRRR